MKLGLSLSGMNTTIKNLQDAGIVVEKNFKTELVEQGKRLRDKAKEILSTQSQVRTSQRYWTGKLHDSIQLNITEERGDMIGIRVGPDMRVAPYAEWVEIGHFLTAGEFGMEQGGWWEGYHYMEGAYTQLAPDIPSKIARTVTLALNKFGRSAGRTRHRKTGKFVAGFGGIS